MPVLRARCEAEFYREAVFPCRDVLGECHGALDECAGKAIRLCQLTAVSPNSGIRRVGSVNVYYPQRTCSPRASEARILLTDARAPNVASH